MIIGLNSPEEIGTIITGTYWEDPNGIKRHRNARVYILRKASLEEWIQYRESRDLPTNFPNRELGFFYEVSTD